MRQIPAATGQLGEVSGEAASDPISDEANGPPAIQRPRCEMPCNRLLADPQRLAAARAFASELAAQWSWPRCVEAYRSVYDRVRR